MREDAIQRPRHPSEIERVDEQGRGLDLPAAAGAEEEEDKEEEEEVGAGIVVRRSNSTLLGLI